jgi:site-specific DNA-methyltransferase (adenine-specific)
MLDLSGTCHNRPPEIGQDIKMFQFKPAKVPRHALRSARALLAFHDREIRRKLKSGCRGGVFSLGVRNAKSAARQRGHLDLSSVAGIRGESQSGGAEHGGAESGDNDGGAASSDDPDPDGQVAVGARAPVALCSVATDGTRLPGSNAGSASLVEGDAATVLAGLAESSIDAVVCDPPHQILRERWDVLTPEEVWRAICRVLRPGGVLLAICAPRTYHQIASRVEAAGLEIEDMAVWAFATGRPASAGHLRPAHAPILVARRPGRHRAINVESARLPFANEADAAQTSRINTLRSSGERRGGIYDSSLDRNERERAPFTPKTGRWPTNVLLTEPQLGPHDRFFLVPKTRSPSGHPAAKPVELLAHLLKVYTEPGETILDPFAGGGATGVAAILAGRRALLIEREPEFAEICERNLCSAREGDFGLPARVRVGDLAKDEVDLRGVKNMSENEALRCFEKRATVASSSELVTRDELASRLRITPRTLQRWCGAGKICAIRIGRTVRFRLDEVLAHLGQGVANDVVLPRSTDGHVGRPGPADRSGQEQTSSVPARAGQPSRRARRRRDDDRGVGGGDGGHTPGPSGRGEEVPGSGGPGAGPERDGEADKARRAADVARLLYGPRGQPPASDL